jgi:hypothetical protein
MFDFSLERQRRRNLVAETQHDKCVREDYKILRDLGIAVAREGIPWAFVDKNGQYDFSAIDPMIEAMNESQILPIWDLCHYGYPDDLDPFSEEFTIRLPIIAAPPLEYVVPRIRGPHFFTPINEITFFSFIGGEWGWTAPYKNTKEDRLNCASLYAKPRLPASKRFAKSSRSPNG